MYNLLEHETLPNIKLSHDEYNYLIERHNKHIDVIPNNKRFNLKSKSFVGKIVFKDKEIRIKTKVPTSNLLYMLAFKYDLGQFIYNDNYDIIKNEGLFEVLVFVFLKWVERVIKQGLYRTYKTVHEKIAGVRGKILFHNINITKDKLFCEYHFITHSVLENIIIKSTLFYILRLNLPQELLNKAKYFIRQLATIEYCELSLNLFKSINYNRLNIRYRKIIDLCKLIFTSSYFSSLNNTYIFSSYLVDMNKLFETFIYKYLKEKLKGFRISRQSKRDKWAEGCSSVLPSIIPDIVINKKLVIDTKYYKDILNERQKLRSGNLYQLLSYMQIINVNGLLIYPKNNEDVDYIFRLENGKLFRVISVDLSGSISDFKDNMNILMEQIRDYIS